MEVERENWVIFKQPENFEYGILMIKINNFVISHFNSQTFIPWLFMQIGGVVDKVLFSKLKYLWVTVWNS